MEFLKELFGDKALTFDEFAKAVEGKKMKLADLSAGAYVSKDKLDAKLEELKAIQESLAQKDAALKKWDGVDLEKLKADNAAETTKLNARIADLQKQNAIDTTLLGENIQDLKAIKAYIDLDVIKIGEDGAVTGLKEQVDKLKSEKSFLFKSQQQPTGQAETGSQKKLTTGVPHDTQPDGNVFSLKEAIADKLGINK